MFNVVWALLALSVRLGSEMVATVDFIKPKNKKSGMSVFCIL